MCACVVTVYTLVYEVRDLCPEEDQSIWSKRRQGSTLVLKLEFENHPFSLLCMLMCDCPPCPFCLCTLPPVIFLRLSTLHSSPPNNPSTDPKPFPLHQSLAHSHHTPLQLPPFHSSLSLSPKTFSGFSEILLEGPAQFPPFIVLSLYYHSPSFSLCL